MTRLSILLAGFPCVVLLLVLLAGVYWCLSPGLLSGLALVFTLYGFPLLCYRIHNWIFPLREGVSYLQGRAYSSWWGGHQMQAIYNAFPALETILRLIPGLFSLWLRLWGAKIGRQVYWTPHLEITDRGLLEIGDRVLVGHRVQIFAHVIKPRRQNLMLYVKKIKIGHDVFLGAGSRLAPGAEIADATFIPILSDIYPNQTVK